MKKLMAVRPAPAGHWVGDGFPVKTLFGPNSAGGRLSPFLLLDYAGPLHFEPTNENLGVDEHPHKGFETVTIVFQGELEHRDSAGNKGKIGPGDVQWMTAGAGVVHEEKHSEEFARSGGTFEVVQLWVNLRSQDKRAQPKYQTLLSSEIPVMKSNGSHVRVIAGDYDGKRGPAQTFTPINVYDVDMKAGSSLEIPIPSGFSAIAAVLDGRLNFEGAEAGPAETAIFEHEGDAIRLEALEDTHVLVLGGEPIDEPIAAYGPFVMNTPDEINEAIEQYRTGRMGQLAARG